MNILTPKLNASDVAEAKSNNFPAKALVPAGEYELAIPANAAPRVTTSDKGTKTLSVMLVHTGENARTAPAIYQTFNTSPVGQKQFTQFLLALGLSDEDVLEAAWGTEGDVQTDSRGKEFEAGIIAVRGDVLNLAGRSISAYVTIEDGKNGYADRNKVSRFIVK